MWQHLFWFLKDLLSDLTLPMTKIRALSDKKMANRPLKHLKKSVFSKSARGMIYFWAFSIKGIYMDYQKPSPDLTHWPRPWRRPWPVVSAWGSILQIICQKGVTLGKLHQRFTSTSHNWIVIIHKGNPEVTTEKLFLCSLQWIIFQVSVASFRNDFVSKLHE